MTHPDSVVQAVAEAIADQDRAHLRWFTPAWYEAIALAAVAAARPHIEAEIRAALEGGERS